MATIQPERVLVGNCPVCGRVIVQENNHEGWPIVDCSCDWSGTTTEVMNRHRVDRLTWSHALRVPNANPNIPLHVPANYELGNLTADGTGVVLDYVAGAAPTTRWARWVLAATPEDQPIPDVHDAIRMIGSTGLYELWLIEPF